MRGKLPDGSRLILCREAAGRTGREIAPPNSSFTFDNGFTPDGLCKGWPTMSWANSYHSRLD